MVDAVSIVSEYLKTEPWLKLLYDHLGYFFFCQKSEILREPYVLTKVFVMPGLYCRLEFVDPTMKETNTENLPNANENKMEYSNSSQVCVCFIAKSVEKFRILFVQSC